MILRAARSYILRRQCLTLAPVVGFKARTASEEDKEWLAGALFHLRKPSTGSLEGDVLQLSAQIQKCVVPLMRFVVTCVLTGRLRLVDDLGLHSTLEEYKVPREDLPQIAQLAVGNAQDPVLPQVVALLEGLYA